MPKEIRTMFVYDEDEPAFPEDQLVLWGTGDGRVFVPTTKTFNKLVPGVYDIKITPSTGLFFEKIPLKTEDLINFPDTRSAHVIKEVKNFWDREKWFRDYGLVYKRGVLLYGPPGSGKSSTVMLVVKDVIHRGGVVLRFDNPEIFTEGLRHFRRIQKDTPVVVIMEDLDVLLETNDESDILNILDGVTDVDKVLFLATTNYPDKLDQRVANRPSRFDKRFRIGFPSKKSRRIYFENLIGADKLQELNIDIDKWVEDTDQMSIAHLKELFIAVIILGDDYSHALGNLKAMKEEIKDNDFEGNLGFGNKEQSEDYYD